MCQSCEAVRINGVLCHEKGCPNAWRDYTRECKWCGLKYKPEKYNQQFCDTSCYCAYNGILDDQDDQDDQ